MTTNNPPATDATRNQHELEDQGRRRVQPDTVFTAIVSTVSLLVGAVAGFAGAWITTAAQLRHDADARHDDQISSACVNVAQAMRGELTELNGGWATASLDDGRDVFQSGVFRSLMTAQAKTADVAPTLYLIGSIAILRDLRNYDNHASLARVYILEVMLGKIPKADRESVLDKAERELNQARLAQTTIIDDCRVDISR